MYSHSREQLDLLSVVIILQFAALDTCPVYVLHLEVVVRPPPVCLHVVIVVLVHVLVGVLYAVGLQFDANVHLLPDAQLLECLLNMSWRKSIHLISKFKG